MRMKAIETIGELIDHLKGYPSKIPVKVLYEPKKGSEHYLPIIDVLGVISEEAIVLIKTDSKHETNNR